MTSFDISKAFHNRNFFRFTGPPENWLTAIKYMTWGLEEKYIERWKKITSGDVFLMHSTNDSSYVKNSGSKVVGLGVVGGAFTRKTDHLWIQEIRKKESIWPLRVPFSEIYLFGELPAYGTWSAPGIASDLEIEGLIKKLVTSAVPTNQLYADDTRFPVMGSISAVKNLMADELLKKGSLYLYNEFYEGSNELEVTDLVEVKDSEANIRYAPTLKFLQGAGVKIRRQPNQVSEFERDNTLLERAEEGHAEILTQAIDFFRGRGYNTWSNVHVDLLAAKDDKAYLVEVKSTVNSNFRPQARRAIGQLFEYAYFDVRKHFEKNQRHPDLNKMLMVSSNPSDQNYAELLETLKISLAWPHEKRFRICDIHKDKAYLMEENT